MRTGSVSPVVITEMIASVRNTAAGSLLPDSSSSIDANFPSMRTPRERRMEKTAAASVEAITAPSSSPCWVEISSRTMAIPPRRPAVITTPMLANAMP